MHRGANCPASEIDEALGRRVTLASAGSAVKSIHSRFAYDASRLSKQAAISNLRGMLLYLAESLESPKED